MLARSGDSLLLEHLEKSLELGCEGDPQIAADATRFLQLLEFQLRTQRLQSNLVYLLISLTLAHAHLLKSLDCWPRTVVVLKYLCQKYQSSSGDMALLVICIALISESSQDVAEAKTVAVKIALKSLNHSTIDLLRALYKRDGGLAAFCAALEVKLGWTAEEIAVALSLANAEERDSIYEVLSERVASIEDLGHFISLLSKMNGSLGNFLSAHDCLLRLGYPLEGTRQFSLALAKVLQLINAASDKYRWVFSNICLNLDRFIDGISPGAPTVPLTAVCEMLKVLVKYYNIQPLLSKFSQLVERARGSISREFLSTLTALIHENPQYGELQSIWQSLCRHSLADGRDVELLLESMESDRTPWVLLTVDLLDLVNPRLQHYVRFGSRILLVLQKAFNSVLSNQRPVESFPESLLSLLSTNLSAFLKGRTSHTTSANGTLEVFAIQSYGLLIKVFADCLIFQVRLRQKSWKQIFADYSISAPWVLYGVENCHFLLMVDLLVAFLRRINSSEEVRHLLTLQKDCVLVAAISEVLFRSNLEQLQLGQFHKLLYAHASPYSSYSQSLLMAVAKANPKLPPFSTLSVVYQKSPLFCTPALAIDRVELAIEMAKSLGILSGKLLHKLLFEAVSWDTASASLLAAFGEAVMSASAGDSSAQDNLDWYLYTLCCNQGTKFIPGSAACSAGVGDFLLTRLTSVWLSRLEDYSLFSPNNTLLLMSSFLSVCSAAQVKRFLENLLGVAAGQRGHPGIQTFLNMTLQSTLSEHRLLLRLPLRLVLSLADTTVLLRSNLSGLPEPEVLRLRLGNPTKLLPDYILLLRLARWSHQFGEAEPMASLLALIEAAEHRSRLHHVKNPDFDTVLASEGLVMACTRNHPLYDRLI